MPKRNPGRLGETEGAARKVIGDWLETNDRPVRWLSVQAGMGETALWRVLNHGRTLYVNDAIGLSAAMGMPIEELLGVSP